MGSNNVGNQIVTFSYGERAESVIFNSLNHKVIPAGIYAGGELTKISNTAVSIAPGVFVLEDTSKGVTVRVETQNTYSLDSAHPTTPVLVITLPWLDSQTNYAEFHWRASVGIQVDDVILGTLLFSGTTLTGFDYSSRDDVNLDNRGSLVWSSDVYYDTGESVFYESNWFVSKLDNNQGNTPPVLPSYEDSYWLNIFGPAPSSTNYISASNYITENLSTLDSQVGTNASDIVTHNHDALYLNESNNLSDLDDIPTARSNLGLGTAALADIQVSTTDTTSGRVITFGGFGIGELITSSLTDLDSYTTPGRYRTPAGVLTSEPSTATLEQKVIFIDKDDTGNVITQILLDTGNKKIYSRTTTTGSLNLVSWLEFVDTSELLAENISIDDTGGLYSATDVNAALQEVADKSPVITLTGDATGNATLTNLGDASLSVTVVDDSHTHNTQYYTETESDTRFVRADNLGLEEMQGSLSVQGDFTVSGTTTTIDTEEIKLADNIITLNSNYTGSTPTENSGLEVERGTLTNYQFMFNEATDTFVIGLIGDQHPVATRQETPTANAIPYWNSAVLRLDSSDVTVVGSVMTGSLTGNASTATQLATARTISLTSDVTGSTSFDGSGNVSITATVANDSHTHDTRYYTETEADARFLLESNNLSDLTNATTARTNLGLTTVASTGNHSDLTLDDGTNPHGTTPLDVGISTYGQALVNDPDAATARTTLGLGTAAIADVTTSATDTTANRLMKVGDFGVGDSTIEASSGISLDDATLPNGLYHYSSGPTPGTPPSGLISGTWLQNQRTDGLRGHQIFFGQGVNSVYVRAWDGSAWTSWVELYHSGNTNAANWDTAYTHSQITTGNPHSLSPADIGAAPDYGGTTFTGTYPVTVNVSGTPYSHTSITYNGSAQLLTVPNISADTITGTVSDADVDYGNYEIVHNATSDSLDFNYIG